jgi:CRP-like cAMP-binding protein
VFGEIGVFAENPIRTSSAICTEDCEMYRISGEKVIELFYQEPRFGFFIVKALSQYLINDARHGSTQDQ